MMLIVFWCALFFEILFLLLYRNTYSRYKKIRHTGRLHEINYTKNWVQFFKILLIFLPVLLLLFFDNPFV
jgi:hypothetical protein